jgi:hypothetical protein
MARAGRSEKSAGRRFGRFVCSIAVLAILSAVSYVLIAGNGRLDIDSIKRVLDDLRGRERADEYICAQGYDSAFADMDGVLVAAGTFGFMVMDVDGRQIARESFKMEGPMAVSSGKFAAVYDAGGTDARIVSRRGEVVAIESEAEIIAASINKNGWLALCTLESEGYKGGVTVYNAGGEPQYKWRSAQGYILSSALADDDLHLAVLSVRGAGGAVTLLQLKSEDVQAEFALGGGVILDIRYTGEGRVLAVTEDALISIDGAGEGSVIRDFSDKYLGGWAIGADGSAALLILDYGVGDSGALETYSASGAALGAIRTDRRCGSLSIGGGHVAALWRDSIGVYDAPLKSAAEIPGASDFESVIARPDGSALAIGHGVAKVVAG